MAKQKNHTYRVQKADWGVDYVGTIHAPAMVNPVVGAVVMTAEGDGAGNPSTIYCPLPGGAPWMEIGPRATPVAIVNGPTCDTLADLFAFVVDRFGRDEVEEI